MVTLACIWPKGTEYLVFVVVIMTESAVELTTYNITAGLSTENAVEKLRCRL